MTTAFKGCKSLYYLWQVTSKRCFSKFYINSWNLSP